MTEARAGLSGFISAFGRGEYDPVFIGAQRRVKAVILPWPVYGEMMLAMRAHALREATVSVQAEGLTAGPEIDPVMMSWVRGEIGTPEMRRRVLALYNIT